MACFIRRNMATTGDNSQDMRGSFCWYLFLLKMSLWVLYVKLPLLSIALVAGILYGCDWWFSFRGHEVVVEIWSTNYNFINVLVLLRSARISSCKCYCHDHMKSLFLFKMGNHAIYQQHWPVQCAITDWWDEEKWMKGIDLWTRFLKARSELPFRDHHRLMIYCPVI